MSATNKAFHEKYFEILEDYFGLHYKRMKRKKQDVLEAANEACNKIYDESLASSVFESLMEDLHKLDWTNANTNVNRLGGVKALFQTPLHPSKTREIANRIALYADTIICSGIILHSRRTAHERWEPRTRIFAIIASALGILRMKDLFLADVTPPIAVIAEPVVFLNPAVTNLHEKLTNHDAIKICSEICKKEFSSIDEVYEFILTQKKLDNLKKAIKKPDLFYDSRDSFISDIRNTMKAFLHAMPHAFESLNDPNLLYYAFSNRLFSIGKPLAQLISCGSLGADPVIDDTFEWRLLLWKFKHDSELLAKKLKFRRPSKHYLVMNTLQLDDFRWLGNVPTDSIIRMRQEGELQGLRDLIGKNIQDLKDVTDEDFVRIGQEIKYNLNQALKKHVAEVKGLNEKYRRKYNFGIASSIVTGTLAFTTALYPPLALATGIASAIGGGTIIGTIEKLREVREELKELQKKPVAMLFEAKKLAT